MAAEKTMSSLMKVLMAIGLVVVALGVIGGVLEAQGVINIIDERSTHSREYDLCYDLVITGRGALGVWETRQGDLKNQVRFCSDYHRCVFGCAMLLELVEAGNDGNVVRGVENINAELEAYRVDIYTSDLLGRGYGLVIEDFNRPASGVESDARLVDSIAGAVKDALDASIFGTEQENDDVFTDWDDIYNFTEGTT
ncbi:MAG TPA: hypothetical protein ENN60_02115 [archaeon]|nr:hypothetical protein [archaeon]